MKKTLATLMAVALVGAAFAGPADAKKKKKKKKPKPAVCAAFTPGEFGAEVETVVLTDEHTEEAPLEVPVTLAESVADLTFGETDGSFAYFNVQVDGAAPEAGLYALFEFDARRDYDIDLLHPDGSYAARSHAWNTLIEANDTGTISSTGHGGESTASSEKIVGINTADCAGWTVQAANWLGEGGDFTIKLWLGEVVNEPQAEGEEPH